MTPARPHPALRALYAALALALASGWLLAGAVPAQAQALDWGVESPRPEDPPVKGALTLKAWVESVPQEGESVQARFLQDGLPVEDGRPLGGHHTLTRDRAPDPGPSPQRSTWTASFPADSFANGRYTVQVRVRSNVQPEGTEWRGHGIVLDAPPVAKMETVRVTDASARTVEVRWVRYAAPDMKGYTIQRAKGSGEFTDVHTAEAAESSFTDTVPKDGSYKYRVTAVRAGVDGDHTAVSETKSVKVSASSSGRPEGDGEGPLAPKERTDAAAGPSGGGPAAPRLSTRTRGGTRRSGPSGPNTARPPGDPNTAFSERLDYGVDFPTYAGEGQEQAAGGMASDGGTLQLFERGDNQQSRLKGVAAGLVFVLGGLHILRFLNL